VSEKLPLVTINTEITCPSCIDLRAKLQAAEERITALIDETYRLGSRIEKYRNIEIDLGLQTRRAEAAEAEVKNERERLIALLLYEGTDAVCTEPEVHHDLKMVSMGFYETKLRRLINGED